MTTNPVREGLDHLDRIADAVERIIAVFDDAAATSTLTLCDDLATPMTPEVATWHCPECEADIDDTSNTIEQLAKAVAVHAAEWHGIVA